MSALYKLVGGVFEGELSVSDFAIDDPERLRGDFPYHEADLVEWAASAKPGDLFRTATWIVFAVVGEERSETPAGWQPIETAPKDRPLAGWSMEQGLAAVEWWRGRWGLADGVAEDTGADFSPTHWAELPALPEDKR